MSVVKVTQEDREAAAAAGHAYAMKVLSGKGGGHEVLAQAFARHRQSAIAELCEGLEKAATWFEEYAGAHDRQMREAVDSYERARRADKAIRNAERAKELRTLLSSKHSPDAPGDAGTRAIEPSDGDEA